MAAVTALRTPAETGLGRLFERLKGGLPGDTAIREAALAGFVERGLPHRRVEAFKYFDLRALMRDAAPPAERPDAAMRMAVTRDGTAFKGLAASCLTFVNGHLVSDASDMRAMPAGIEVMPLGSALSDGHPLLVELGSVETARDNPVYQLNSAFMADGAVIKVSGAIATPLHLRFLNAATMPFSTATRILVVVEEGSSLTLLESHEGSETSAIACQPNDVVEIVAGDRAKVNHVRLNAEGSGTLALSTLTARLGRAAAFRTLNVVTGSAAARHQVFVTFSGENATAQVDGVSLLNRRQHADATLVIDHAVPHCMSREIFKTILDDSAVGAFQGKIIVRPHAQKTDGAMKSDTLLLSDYATMNNKPELEIFADDVVCGHGATCGALNEELLFYLKSRGLPKTEAESLLLQAFVGPPLDAITHDGVREALVGVVERWLAGRKSA